MINQSLESADDILRYWHYHIYIQWAQVTLTNLDQYYIYFLDVRNASKRFKHSKILRIIKLMFLYLMWTDKNCTTYTSLSLSLLSSLSCLYTSQTFTQRYWCWVRILYIINFSRYNWKAWDNKTNINYSRVRHNLNPPLHYIRNKIVYKRNNSSANASSRPGSHTTKTIVLMHA